MSLLRDLVATAGDALRLSSDLMQCKLAAQKRTLKRALSRLFLFLTLYLATLLAVGVSVGFLLYGTFVLVARAAGVGPAGLILGGSLLVISLVLLAATGSMWRRL